MSGPLWTPADGRSLDVVGLGQICVDEVCTAAVLPGPGEKVRASDARRLPGGQVATAVAACARLGLQSALVAAVGDDAAAEEALAPLRALGVDVEGVLRRAGVATQRAQIWIEAASGERAIVWHRDPGLALAPEEIPAERIASARVLHLDAGDVQASLAAARHARSAGTASVLDADTPGPGVAELVAEVDFPVVSRSLAETIHGTSRLREALGRMLEGRARMAVVTLGPAGALAQVGSRVIACPAFRVAARDTTGAGDAFRAGLIWGLLEGLAAEEVLRAASGVAALNCRALGAQGGLPDREELEALLADGVQAEWQEPEGAA